MKTTSEIVCENLFGYYIDFLQEDTKGRKILFVINNYLFYYKEGKTQPFGWHSIGSLGLEEGITTLSENTMVDLYVFNSKDINSNCWFKRWWRAVPTREELCDKICDRIKELPNYNELYVEHKIDKKIQNYKKSEERKKENAIRSKATKLNITDQREIVTNIGVYLNSKEEFKDHSLTYFLGVLNGSITSQNVEKSGEKLGEFLRHQFNEKECEEILQFFLTSEDDSCKRFAMIFDKSNAIVNSLDNDNLVRECANFFLKKEEKNEKSKER